MIKAESKKYLILTVILLFSKDSLSFGKHCQQLTPLPHLSGRWPALLFLYIWGETELSKKHWVVWDISRGLQAGQHISPVKKLPGVPKVTVLDTDCVTVQYTQLMSDTC